jgi:hypothetical protein
MGTWEMFQNESYVLFLEGSLNPMGGCIYRNHLRLVHCIIYKFYLKRKKRTVNLKMSEMGLEMWPRGTALA